MGKSNSSRPINIAARVLCLALILPLKPPPVSAQMLNHDAESQLDSLASRVGEKIAKHNREEGPVNVLVFDFTWRSPENSSRLGSVLADRFTQLLKARSNGADVMDRKLLKDYFTDTGTNIEDLHIYPASFELAQKLGATAMIRGNLLEGDKHQLKILLQVQGLGRGFFHYDETEFEISKGMEDSLFQPAPSNSKPADSIPPEPGVLVMGANGLPGVSGPVCISCPAPIPFPSLLAMDAKVTGTIVLSAVVTKTGDITAIYAEKGLPLGMTQDFVEAVKKWKLNPAVEDGKAVSVRIEIQITIE